MRLKSLVTSAPGPRQLLPLDKAVEVVALRTMVFHRRLQLAAKGSLLALFVASVLLTILGIGASLDWPFPGAGIVLIVLCALPGLLQMFDMLWPDVGVGQYRALFSRLQGRLTEQYRRKRLRYVFTVYGCQSLAEQLAPADIDHYSILWRLRRRRLTIGTLAAAVALATAVSAGLWIWDGLEVRHYGLNDRIELSQSWAIEVLAPPNCRASASPQSEPICTIDVAVINAQQSEESIRIADFDFLDPDGMWQGRYLDGLYVCLMAGSYYYGPTYDENADSTEHSVYPGDDVHLSLVIGVPTGAYLTELRFASGRNPNRIYSVKW